MREGKVSSYEVRVNQFILLATNARECLKRRDVKIYTCVIRSFHGLGQYGFLHARNA